MQRREYNVRGGTCPGGWELIHAIKSVSGARNTDSLLLFSTIHHVHRCTACHCSPVHSSPRPHGVLKILGPWLTCCPGSSGSTRPRQSWRRRDVEEDGEEREALENAKFVALMPYRNSSGVSSLLGGTDKAFTLPVVVVSGQGLKRQMACVMPWLDHHHPHQFQRRD